MTIYLTDAEQFEADAMFWGGMLLLLAAVAANLRFKLFKKQPTSKFKTGH